MTGWEPKTVALKSTSFDPTRGSEEAGELHLTETSTFPQVQDDASVRELYPNSRGSAAVALIAECVESLTESYELACDGDLLEADANATEIRRRISRLFRLAEEVGMGGVAALAASCLSALRPENPLEAAEYGALRKALKELEVQPYLSRDQVCDIVEELADAGLVVFPPELGAIADIGAE